MLYLVSTPIGNLKDITLRALEVLKSCDYVLCEDTRHSSILFSHYDIHSPLKSFHKFNEVSQENTIIQDLQNGKEIALISDAGTPAIADPGMRLVQQCIEMGLSVTSIPGPCAAIAALVSSGLSTAQFQFVGFLPHKQTELQISLFNVLQYNGTSILYEAPHRLVSLLAILKKIEPNRRIVICRELTKKFETIYRGTCADLYGQLADTTIKGECILLIEATKHHGEQNELLHLSHEEHVVAIMNTYGITKKEAIKLVAEARNLSKKEVYKALIKSSTQDS